MLSSKEDRFPAGAAQLAFLLFLAIMFLSVPTSAQTFQVLHNFTAGLDGANPEDGLTIDRNGNLYGTAAGGGYRGYNCVDFEGTPGCGTIFELVRAGTGWMLKPLYAFQGGDEGGDPGYGVTIGTDGALYGVVDSGSGCSGNGQPCGIVYRLRPPANPCVAFLCPWEETTLHQFSGAPDANLPSSRLIADGSGNLYGVTVYGGQNNQGAVYELTRNGGSWTENVIYSFNSSGGLGTALPGGQLAIDPTGNLYGPANCNIVLGCFYGAVWQLQTSQSGWTLNSLFQFNGFNGYQPVALVRDPAGNLYGTTLGDGSRDSGAVYELSNGQWNYTQVYNYGGFGEDSTYALVMDSGGNLYGADSISGDGYIFKLTRAGSGWTFSRLHSFSGSDGAGALGNLVLDSNGNLYGTTLRGGSYGFGTIWEITP